MLSRQTTLAKLAETFGRSLLENTTREGGRLGVPVESRRQRLRKIARVMDRLSRRPDSSTWHSRAARLHQEIAATLHSGTRYSTNASLWATA